nr:response regulator [Streptomyces boncukensis]
MVVDDDFMVARLHSTLVERVPGFEVAAVAHTGAEAVSRVRALRPDLVLLDLYLPDLSGLEVLRRLRGDAAPGEGPDVLVVTAARDAESVRAAQHGGAVQYVVKPFEGRLLQERLRRYAERLREFERLAAAGQDGVDRLMGARGAPGGGATLAPAAPAAALPKGLTEQTCALVRGVLDAAGGDDGLSASECAERSGLSRVSARRYLEHFVATGTAQVTLRYGATGRPERRYHRL